MPVLRMRTWSAVWAEHIVCARGLFSAHALDCVKTLLRYSRAIHEYRCAIVVLTLHDRIGVGNRVQTIVQ